MVNPEPHSGSEAVPGAGGAHQDSCNWFESILDIAPDAIITTDMRGVIISFSRGAEEMFGYRAGETIGRSIEMLLPERYREMHARERDRFTRGEAKTRYMGHRPAIRGLRRDGTEFRAEASIARVEHGEIVHLAVIVRDMTERFEAEEALRRSEERARALFEEAVDAIVIFGAGDVIEDANDAACRLLDYERAAVLGRSLFEFVPGHRREAARAVLASVRSGEVVDLDTDLVSRGGKLVASHVRVNALSDGRVLVVFRDITERLAAQQALRESEELFRQTFDGAPTGISVMGLDCKRVWVNQAWCEMLGYTRDELIGGNFQQLTHADDLPAELVLTGELKRGERRLYQMEKRYIRKDGSIVWALVAGTALRDEEGTITRFVAHIQDITEHKLAEEALRESEERLRSIIEEAQIILLRLDEHGVFTFCEGRGLESLGIAAGALTGQSVWSLPGTTAETLELLHTVYAGQPVVDTLEIGDKVFELRLSPIAGEGRVAGVIGVVFDITERRDLELRLQRAQRLETIGQLAGGVAHDFNNLVTVINGYADLALHSLDNPDSLRMDLQEILNAAERAASLTQQLLSFSRRQATRPTVVDLNDILRGVETMLRRLLGAGVELMVELAPAPLLILADAGRLEQVIMNLAINARDAMPEGGELRISTRPGPADDEVTLIVTDTGMGMPPEVQARIFDPFYTTKGHGTGLGLATVQNVVMHAGGSIAVESEPGRGTAFTIRLPRSDGQEPAGAHSAAEPPAAHASEAILVVEPDEGVRAFIAGVLGRAGYRVLEADDGRAALTVAAGDTGLDLVLCGLSLPGLSGLELAEQLRRSIPGRRMLFMSSYAEAEQAAVAGPASAEFIRKPFTADRLLRRVREVLDSPPPG